MLIFIAIFLGTFSGIIACVTPTLSTPRIYRGCFVDKAVRAMPSNFIQSEKMTIDQCIGHCRDRGHMFAGLQYARECFCGDHTYNKYGRSPDKECNMNCKGNSHEKCGGSWRNSVYATRELLSRRPIAIQSSIGWDGKAERAIDGNKAAVYGQKSCTHTQKQAENWWMLDLGKSYRVKEVKIYNRADCCKERLNGAIIRVGDDANCMLTFAACGGPVKNADTSPVINRKCSLNGQYVSVSLKNNYLTLCEVEVYGEDYIGCFKDTRNRALPSAFKASDSMTIDQCIAHCRDRGHMFAGLQYARECFCGEHTYNKYGRRPDNECNMNCKGNSKEKCGDSWRNSVYATTRELLSRGPIATQSSIGWGGNAERAIDGNRAAVYGQKSCTHTEKQAENWWMVDLGKSSMVKEVTIYNRQDCCKDRLNGAIIRVGNNAKGMLTNAVCGKPIKDADSSPVINRKCSLNGRYVSVSLKNNYLTLCEVEVWGEAL